MDEEKNVFLRAWANYAADAPTEKRHLLERRSEKCLSADTTQITHSHNNIANGGGGVKN